MKLFKHWGLLLLTSFFSIAADFLWPRREQLGLQDQAGLITVILFKPFHYLLSILFLLFAMLMITEIARKVIYECKVAYLFRVIPYESLILGLISLYIYIKMLRFQLLWSIVFSVACAGYYLIDYFFYQRQEKEYVRE